MTVVMLTLVLAALWLLLTGLSWSSLAGAVAFGALAGWISHPLFPTRDHRHRHRLRPLALVVLVVLFLKELLVSALRVLAEVALRRRAAPGVVAVPLAAETDLEITLFASLVTLTPGTIAVEVSPDRSVLYVHALFCAEPEAARQHMKTALERPTLKVLR